ncbi:hypothetical protein L210DRAFT_3499473 [Boletus edulis BED1]|uniref:Uncharacterized protein n=1 Tax=Boletus edulis BED1 TaxID=1328754 RepID=A0AAD4CA69_BOLED|nr:hypothetical protein L210DRAFT_3499473 [Boletus edulis BED1]
MTLVAKTWLNVCTSLRLTPPGDGQDVSYGPGPRQLSMAWFTIFNTGDYNITRKMTWNLLFPRRTDQASRFVVSGNNFIIDTFNKSSTQGNGQPPADVSRVSGPSLPPSWCNAVAEWTECCAGVRWHVVQLYEHQPKAWMKDMILRQDVNLQIICIRERFEVGVFQIVRDSTGPPAGGRGSTETGGGKPKYLSFIDDLYQYNSVPPCLNMFLDVDVTPPVGESPNAEIWSDHITPSFWSPAVTYQMTANYLCLNLMVVGVHDKQVFKMVSSPVRFVSGNLRRLRDNRFRMSDHINVHVDSPDPITIPDRKCQQ